MTRGPSPRKRSVRAVLQTGVLVVVLSSFAASALAQQPNPGPVTRRPPGAEPLVPMPVPAPREILVPPTTEPARASPLQAKRQASPAIEVEPGGVQVLDPSVFEGVFAAYTVRNGRQIPNSLTGRPGDPVAGRRLYHNFSRTGCSLCHGTAESPRDLQENLDAPDLYQIGQRLSSGRIRLWIVAPETMRVRTAMPAFHKPGQRNDPTDPLYGGPRLTAAEVEEIVAYLTRDAPEGGVEEPLDANVIPGQVPGVGQAGPDG